MSKTIFGQLAIGTWFRPYGNSPRRACKSAPDAYTPEAHDDNPCSGQPVPCHPATVVHLGPMGEPSSAVSDTMGS